MSSRTTDLESLIAFACELADRSGKVILPHFRAGEGVDNKAGAGDYDPVTAADRDAEAAIRARIKEVYPEHGILGEEHGYERGTGEHTWVLDPIDGTRAFIAGLPLWGTLIALRDKRPIVGVMDQPFTGERFIGSARGSELVRRTARGDERTTLRSRKCTRVEDALVMCTSPHMLNREEHAAFEGVRARARLVRYGGDCYAYAMVALGTVDAVIEAGLKPYDIQALVPIIEAAGGIVTTWSGGVPDEGGQILAVGDRALHTQLLGMLAGAVR
jgi:myo-inositol-1(or 4)-monophosphatase